MNGNDADTSRKESHVGFDLGIEAEGAFAEVDVATGL
jgi:hypothetical protein